jgi:hypothetical protein
MSVAAPPLRPQAVALRPKSHIAIHWGKQNYLATETRLGVVSHHQGVGNPIEESWAGSFETGEGNGRPATGGSTGGDIDQVRD